MKILSLPVTWAMGILTALGVASILTFAGGELSIDFKARSQLKQDALLSSLAAEVGGLTHELQKERGASAGYLASNGTAFVDALPEQRKNSDAVIAAYKSAEAQLRATANISPGLDALLRDVDSRIAALTELRAQVDALSIERPQAVGQITALNRAAIGLLPEIGKSVSYPNAARAIQRHAILMTAKDVMGLERAFGAAGFAQAASNAGVVPDAIVSRFETLVDEQETLLAVYSAIASSSMLKQLEDLSLSEAAAGVVDMRGTLTSGDPALTARVAPEVWFQAISDKINLMKSVEDAGTAEIGMAVATAIERESRALNNTLLRLGLNGLVLAILSAGLIHLTAKSLNMTANRVAGLAAGDIDSPVVQAPQRDLAKITAALEQFQIAERDRRAEAQRQTELESASADGIKRISSSVSKGDFDVRLRLRNLQGASLILGEGVNEILSSAQSYVENRQRQDAELLAQKQNESEAQDRAIEALDTVVSSYTLGDFSKRMETEGLDGIWQRVAQGINQIASMTEDALSDIRSLMMAVASGTLTGRMSDTHQGTFAEISEATNSSLAKLEAAFGNISEGVIRVGEASMELRKGSKDLTTRSDEQASTVADSAEATQDLSKSIEENSLNLGRCNDLMNALQSKTAEGQGVAKDAVESMSGIEQASKEMEKIVATIEEIAFQTNLLALNASVEAARAGDAGKGFAVVAAEVRGLANRCADASRQIGDLIADSVRGVTEGASHVRRTGEAIGDVEETLKAVQSVIDDVLVAGAKQSDGVSTLTRAVERLDKMASSNVDLARGNMELTETLSSQETLLSAAVDGFLADGKAATSSTRKVA